MRHIATAAASIVALLASTQAFAHAHLKGSTPAADATVTTSPAEVAIDFSEEIEPKFSSIAVDDAKGARVDNGDVHSAADNAKRLVVSLKPLKPGTYKVMWRVTSTDTHKTNGSFNFRVGE
jgi:methionine-rich copper-binding protein CopC